MWNLILFFVHILLNFFVFPFFGEQSTFTVHTYPLNNHEDTPNCCGEKNPPKVWTGEVVDYNKEYHDYDIGY